MIERYPHDRNSVNETFQKSSYLVGMALRNQQQILVPFFRMGTRILLSFSVIRGILNKTSAAERRFFCPPVRFKKQEMHPVFCCFSNLLVKQNPSSSALADSIRASLDFTLLAVTLSGQTKFLLKTPAEIGIVCESNLIGNPGNRHFRAGKEGLRLFQTEFFQILTNSHA